MFVVVDSVKVVFIDSIQFHLLRDLYENCIFHNDLCSSGDGGAT